MMRFGNPAYFNLLWLFILLIAFLVYSHKKKKQLLEVLLSGPLVSRLLAPMAWKRVKTETILTALAIFFLIFALTQPRWGYRWEDLTQEGVDIIIALDVSSSMLAQDIKPNRLERAKHKIADLLNMLDGDRIGLVAFAGTSYLQCPLTLDYSAANIFLNAIDTQLIPVQGTAIGHAVRTSVKAFNEQDTHSRAIILITDGEDHTGDALPSATWAKEQETKIFAIGIGREIGAPIPNTEPGVSGFKKDKDGEVVLTKLDEPTLQQMALETGGSYVRSVTGDMDLQKIYLENIKHKVDKKLIKTERRRVWLERFQWMIFAALFCLMVGYARKKLPPPGKI
ncbi:MAG: VWA domain-containing protein [Nitrospinaceae bacterium]|jgi:Ca-activated chloride channel family protein|nr:VWA domain-containing protein [Nitrospinaceae bacterium]